MLSIPTARLGNRLVLDPRPLIPLLVAWGAAMAVIGLEDDIGFAALLFVLFIGLLWITTGRLGYLVLGLVLFGVGAYIAARYFGQVHTAGRRVAEPVGDRDQPQLGGRPAAPRLVRLRHRGGRRHRARLRPPGREHPDLTTDMIFAAIGTEMGLVGAAAVVVRLHPARRRRASASPRRPARTSRG